MDSWLCLACAKPSVGICSTRRSNHVLSCLFGGCWGFGLPKLRVAQTVFLVNHRGQNYHKKPLYKHNFWRQFICNYYKNTLHSEKKTRKRPQKHYKNNCFGELFCNDVGQDGKRCFFPSQKGAVLTKTAKLTKFAYYQLKTRASLVRAPKNDENDENGGCHSGKGMV